MVLKSWINNLVVDEIEENILKHDPEYVANSVRSFIANVTVAGQHLSTEEQSRVVSAIKMKSIQVADNL